MCPKESKNGYQYFAFEHNHQYQKIQFQFYDAVESLDPQQIGVGVSVRFSKYRGRLARRHPDKIAYLKKKICVLNQNICCGCSKEPSQ